MHPIPTRGAGLALYLGAWALVGTLLAALLGGSGGVTWAQSLAIALPLSITYAFFCLSAWYVARSMPLSATGAMRIATTGLTAAVLSSGAWLALARGWMGLVGRRGGLDAEGVFARESTLIFGFGLLLYLLSLAVSYLLGSFEQARETERRGLQVQVLAREAELRSLRAQIDPHFLFNSLHSISALTTLDPPGARRMCLRLADFLRDSLTLGSGDRITVGRELALAGRFLEIEQVRFGSRLAGRDRVRRRGRLPGAAAPAAADRRERGDARHRARARRRHDSHRRVARHLDAVDRRRESVRS